MKPYLCFILHKLNERFPAIEKLRLFGTHILIYSLPSISKEGSTYDCDCTCGAEYKVLTKNDCGIYLKFKGSKYIKKNRR